MHGNGAVHSAQAAMCAVQGTSPESVSDYLLRCF